MLNENLGRLIIELRKKNKMSQKELAEKLEVTSSNLSKWEHGQLSPSVSTLNRIAELFQITGDDLLHPEATLQCLQQVEDQTVDTTLQSQQTKKVSPAKNKVLIISLAFAAVLLLVGSMLTTRAIKPCFEVIDSYYDYNGTYGVHCMMSVLYRGHAEYEDFEDFAEKMRIKWINQEFAKDADAIEFRFYDNQYDAREWSETDIFIIIL